MCHNLARHFSFKYIIVFPVPLPRCLVVLRANLGAPPLHRTSQRMPRHNRRTVGPTLFALMSAVRLNAASCFCSPRLQLVPSRPAVSPPPSATTTTALLASATKSTGHPRQRTTRRRARPVWSELGATTTPGIRGISTIIGGYSRGRRRGDLRAKLGAEGASKGDDAAEARGTEAGKRALSVPLTHDQLPGESFYLLDGTSMLFRAFYGRGAGG